MASDTQLEDLKERKLGSNKLEKSLIKEDTKDTMSYSRKYLYSRYYKASVPVIFRGCWQAGVGFERDTILYPTCVVPCSRYRLFTADFANYRIGNFTSGRLLRNRWTIQFGYGGRLLLEYIRFCNHSFEILSYIIRKCLGAAKIPIEVCRIIDRI